MSTEPPRTAESDGTRPAARYDLARLRQLTEWGVRTGYNPVLDPAAVLDLFDAYDALRAEVGE